MFFSKEQIKQSIKRLHELNPFFGTVFLAFCREELPVGITKSINFSRVVEDILQKYHPHYQIAPNTDRRVYTPYKTSNKKTRWNKEPYVSALDQTAKNTFSDAVAHPGGSEWGWKPNYINTLKVNHLKQHLIPAFDLAVWLFRERLWDKDTKANDVINLLLKEFTITSEQEVLFDTAIPPRADSWLQAEAIGNEALFEIIGFPQDSLTEGANLQKLKLISVGPTKQIEFNPAPRLNFITGDNGLGKTFLLECAWWALTGFWPGYPARPRQDTAKSVPGISFQIGKDGHREKVQTTRYNWDQLKWSTLTDRSVLPGLSIFSRFDGSFMVWDPAKHLLARDEHYSGREGEALTSFSRSDIWNGVREEDQFGRVIRVACNGLIYDWVRWQEAADQTRFKELSAALYHLSPDPKAEPLIPGKPIRMVELGDARDIPTLTFPYGDVPILLCSAGIQRIVALAYLLVWTWQEHVRTAESMRREPEKSIVLLIDEMEAHLHPFWQRTIAPALMNVVQELAPEVQTQIIISTHSPLVLASVEPLFDEEKDKLFHLYQENGAVQLDELPFITRGRVDKWLMSSVFGLTQPRSIEAEEAIEEAKTLQRERTPSKDDVQKVSDKLVHVLAQDDDFWPRWTYFAEQRGVGL